MVLGIDERINGVNLGNWLVLEKWMDPEPFARSAEDDEIWMHRTHGALWSERNLAEELRRHRDAYITLEDFRDSRILSCTIVSEECRGINGNNR